MCVNDQNQSIFPQLPSYLPSYLLHHHHHQLPHVLYENLHYRCLKLYPLSLHQRQKVTQFRYNKTDSYLQLSPMYQNQSQYQLYLLKPVVVLITAPKYYIPIVTQVYIMVLYNQHIHAFHVLHTIIDSYKIFSIVRRKQYKNSILTARIILQIRSQMMARQASGLNTISWRK